MHTQSVYPRSRPRTARRGLVLLVAALLFGGAELAPPVAAEPAAPEVPVLFRPLDFSAASAAAAQEQKLLLVDFYTAWCGPCHLLDVTTWRDPRVVELVAAKAVAVKIDAEAERALAKRFKVDAYPTIVVLGADGTERDRYVGYLKAEVFLQRFQATLAGKNSLQVARESVEKDARNPKQRLELARNLAKQDQPAEALAHFLWCYDEGVAADPQFAKQRDERLPGYIAGLRKALPEALDALRVRREALARTIAAAPARATVADYARLGHLDAAVRDVEPMLAMVRSLQTTPKLLRAYGDPVQPRLVDAKHYRAALSIAGPEEELAVMADQLRQLGQSGRMPPEQLAAVRRKAALGGAPAVEMLAGAGELERARKFGEALLGWCDEPAVHAELAKRTERAGATELARHFRGAAPG